METDIRTCRPREALVALAREYPTAWRQVDLFRAARGKDIPMWPDWCFLPLGGSHAIVCGGSNTGEIGPITDVARLGALAAWRVTQGIYRFDPTIYDAVRTTVLEGDIPCSVLYYLPEWCIYMETPGLTWFGLEMHGVWVHLECDANNGRHELRMLADIDDNQLPIILHLGQWSLMESIERFHAEAQRHAGGSLASIEVFVGQIESTYMPLLSLLLYICSQASEIGDGVVRPKNPAVKRIKGGVLRTFPPNKQTFWEVGVRMGSALRKAQQVAESGQGFAHNGPRGHIRRAHWHGFRHGPTKREDGTEIATTDRKFQLRWLPPIAVNLDDVADLPATIRPVTI